MGMENGNGNRASTPSPRDDSIILGTLLGSFDLDMNILYIYYYIILSVIISFYLYEIINTNRLTSSKLHFLFVK